MIIRLTVHDNDFSHLLESFVDTLFDRLYWPISKPSSMSVDEWLINYWKPKRKIQKILNPNITEQLTSEEKLLICSEVLNCWQRFLDSPNLQLDSHDKEYLIKNFNTSISFTFTDKWENGEVFYYFTTNRKWVLQ